MVMRILCILGFTGAGLALLVHLIALLGVNVEGPVPGVWWVNHGALLLFLPIMAISTAAAFGAGAGQRRGARRRPRSPFAPLNARHWLVLTAVGLYAGLHFAVHQAELGGSVVYRDAEGFRRLDRDGVRHQLTREEFDARRAAMFRAFSAGWMVFYLIAAFLCRRAPTPEPAAARGPRLRFPDRAPFVGSGPWREGMN
jgi:hypothetical protein